MAFEALSAQVCFVDIRNLSGFVEFFRSEGPAPRGTTTNDLIVRASSWRPYWFIEVQHLAMIMLRIFMQHVRLFSSSEANIQFHVKLDCRKSTFNITPGSALPRPF